MRKHISTIIMAIIFLTGLSLLLYPTVSNFWNSKHQTQVVAEYSDRIEKMGTREKKQALEQMERFGLAGCEKKYPDELSGGMRQRAAFLRTTLCEAGIYLLDEPFGALDVITRSDMQDWLAQLCQNLKKTILLVTHDTDEAIYLSDRILILGAPGEGIREEISIKEPSRSREWLYEQGSLRAKIHRIIKEKK